MVERHSGKILNVGSTGSFVPGPLMAVYDATKAYVLSFSEALAVELKPSGVTVTALCPGATASGFQERANVGNIRIVQRGLMSAAEVAEQGYRALMAGKAVAVTGLSNQLSVLLPRFLPRQMVARMVMNFQSKLD
jgi:short-subunit dehydrogenase